MTKRKNKRAGRGRRQIPKGLLGAELELVMREHERLLDAAGAAAHLFQVLDIRDLPAAARPSLCRLGAVLSSLPDETLADAMEHALGVPRTRLAAH